MNPPRTRIAVALIGLAAALTSCTPGPADNGAATAEVPAIIDRAPITPPFRASDAPNMGGVPTITPTVLERAPHPHDHFTQGLEVVGGRLMESTGLVGQSRIVRHASPGDPETTVPLPGDVFGEGLTMVDDVVHVLTLEGDSVLRYQWPSLTRLDDLPLEGWDDTQGWGACHDASTGLLWISTGSSTLQGVNPATGQRVRTLTLGDTFLPQRLNELDCADGVMWANLWPTQEAVLADLADGRTLARVDLSDLAEDAAAEADRQGLDFTEDAVPNGAAFTEDGSVWVTGKNWPTMYRVRLDLPG